MGTNTAKNISEFVGESVDSSVVNTLYELMGPEKFNELVNTYIHNSLAHLRTMDQLIAARDYTELKPAVHSMKGSSGNMGAMEVAHICLQIEHLIKEIPIDTQAVDQTVKQMKCAFELAQNQLRR